MPRRFLSTLIALVATVPAFGQSTDMERAVETAARNFRIQTYQNYRTNRAVYDQRIKAANEALRRFRLASDDVGRLQMQQWFFQAGSNQSGTLPYVPEIQLANANDRLRRGNGDRQPQQIGQNQPGKERRSNNGYVVTDYESNPRFQTHRDNDEMERREREKLTKSSGEDTAVTRALKNPGKLFGNIGKSFMRGDQDEGGGNQDDLDQGSNTSMISESGDADMQNALDQIISSDGNSNDFDSLNNQIVGQNLAIGLLNEDFHGDDLKSVDFLSQCVDRLEALNQSQQEIADQKILLGSSQSNELTKVNSLEQISNELMVSVNESAKQLAAGEIEDEDGSLEVSISDLRMRLSEILAEQSF